MDQEIVENIRAALASEERSLKWAAMKSGIAYATFHRKMQGGGGFTVSEVARIADALRVEPNKLLPKSFHRDAVAA